MKVELTCKGENYYLGSERLSLETSLAVANHSPTGFSHGYHGSGPAQLALAICLRLYPKNVARLIYQEVKQQHIALLDFDNKDFTVTLILPDSPLKDFNP